MAPKMLSCAAAALVLLAMAHSASALTLSPNHRVFTSAANLGPETVPNWSGYIGTSTNNTHELFYWFFESRGDASKDPIILWMTGGPGCSGMLALFKENGPYQIQADASLKLNPASWNEAASVLWIDQPVGSGFSYNSQPFGPGVGTETQMAADMSQFLHTFFHDFANYTTQAFTLFGESYAGHYVPALAARLLDDNAAGLKPSINLQGTAIGNGLVSPLVQMQHYADFAYEHGVINNATFGLMTAAIPACTAMIKACNNTNPLGAEECLLATETCEMTQLMPYQLTGRNPYDYKLNCTVPPLCYNFTDVTTYLNMAHVQAALGTTGHTWASCSRLVTLGMELAGDWVTGYEKQFAQVLAAGHPVLAYSGELDFICNWYGGQAWTRNMTWPHRQDFLNAKNTTWMVDGKMAGTAVSSHGFTFLRVADAGHMVPMNQPAAALDMVKRFLSGKPFDG